MNIRYVCLFTIVITFALLVLGGAVHNTNSSLSCPDWPLCYGQLVPELASGVTYVYFHRVIASLVGLCTIIMTFLAFKKKDVSEIDHKIYKYSAFSLFMVITQGLIGAITVLYRLPTIVSTTHLLTSLVFICMLVYVHHLTQTKNVEPSEEALEVTPLGFARMRDLIFITGVAIFFQILLGGMVRHTGAGLAIGLHDGQSALNLVHRYFAFVVLAFTVASSFLSFNFLKNSFKSSLLLPVLLFFLVILQIKVGTSVLATKLATIPTTIHLSIAVLCLVIVWKLFLVWKTIENKYFQEGVHSFLSDLADLAKPKLSGLVMVTVFVGIILAPGSINVFKAMLLLFLIFLVVMGAATLNCYIERDIDKLMERTKNRTLPSGRMNAGLALTIGVLLLVISLPALAFFINGITAILAAIAAFMYLLAYTPMKRKSELAVYVGAIPGAIPPVMGWTGVTGSMDAMAWALFWILFIWQLPHFLAISICHAKDYDAADIKVYPNVKGIPLTKRYIVLFTLFLFMAAVAPFHMGEAPKAYYYSAVGLSGTFLMYAIAGYFVQPGDVHLKSWARKYFLGSVFYLPLLLGAMMFLK
ncbi:MAG: protoheme IX farnesyltransferase [Oligoflexia bacterium]|nr:protoheme IX farnesyltransferase [Oligoflexia bacterium]